MSARAWRGRAAGLLALASLSLASPPARATGFTELGQDIVRRPDFALQLSGYYRARGEALYNLDLDRGLGPSGQPLFPVPADGKGQTLYGADMRLRTDVALVAPGGTLAVKVRLDTLDNVAWGSTTEGPYAASTTQQSPSSPVRVRRAYGMALTPFGVLLAGRMGHHFGLGMSANGGDCADCDSGDAADRVAFLVPLASHVWALAYDRSATGPITRRPDGVRSVDPEPSDDVHTLSFAFLRFHEEAARERRRRAGKGSFEYGGLLSHRFQSGDVPASYVPTARPVDLGPSQLVHRGYSATVLGGWLRATLPWLRAETEVAYVTAKVDQVSLIPGVELRQPARSKQLGVAFESELGSPDGPATAGLDAGYASGDPAPGFGAFPGANAKPAQKGDLDGPQASPPRDNRVDNFRFHPDYRIDRILFREIIGTVTDAVYVRPHARATLASGRPGTLSASLAAIWSWAVYAESTPGQKHPLGVELDPTLLYQAKDGFSFALEHGILFPGAALDNPTAKLPARTAQVVRVRMLFAF